MFYLSLTFKTIHPTLPAISIFQSLAMLPETFKITDYTPEQLRVIYQHLKKVLGDDNLNLHEELVQHYYRCKDAAETAVQFSDSSTNVGALLSATTASLKELVKMQTELGELERIKRLQQAVVATLQEHPDRERLVQALEWNLARLEG